MNCIVEGELQPELQPWLLPVVMTTGTDGRRRQARLVGVADWPYDVSTDAL
jgi:hypothetical protein